MVLDNETKRGLCRVFAIFLSGIIIGAGSAALIVTGFSAGNTGRVDAVTERHSGIDAGFREQRELIEKQRELIDGIESEIRRAREAVDTALSISGRADERLSKIIVQMEVLVDCIGRVELRLNGGNSGG